MGFFSKIANFGSKILGGVKHAVQWVAPALHSVFSKVAGPAGMIHPGIGAALGAGANLAGAVDRLIRAVRQLITNDIAYYIQYSKRGGNSAGGMLQNEDYQLFIDDDNALVYAANNQIIDGQASDFALKIAADVNQLQSTVGSIDADIVGVKNDIITIQQELTRQQHFRGYYLLNTDIQNLSNSADGDFAFSAESGTVWMYSDEWYNSGDVVPDQVSPASDAVPNVDSGAGVAGISTEYSRGDHQHPLQISEQIPSRDTGTGAAGTSTAYSRADHQHILNTDPTVANLPQKDTGTGNNGNLDYYARSNHAHPLNVDPTAANVPLVNATAAANCTSDFYSRNDHVHPQQLTYDGNITATKFIKTGGTANDILLADGSTKQTTGINNAWVLYFNDGVDRYGELCPIINATFNEGIRISRNPTNLWSNIQFGADPNSITGYIDNQWLIGSTGNNGVNPLGFIIVKAGQEGTSSGLQINQYGNVLNFYGKMSSGNIQINPSATGYDDGLRISRAEPTSSGNSSIQLGCSRNSTTGAIDGQWSIFTPPSSSTNNPQSLVIAVASQAGDNTRGLQISADGNTLTFNGRVL
ncbi:MAG: hypothetical protein EZS28_020585 [Streblomastix strix]|uniref:Uncharacterized protein n=1 Tax=Streblomastix strix TaxID=222440 RepID=A0A5J4VNJ3_9EUKA|nr:MAG: hypothetical protein EZS28_020585 [Streblomastix strix]